MSNYAPNGPPGFFSFGGPYRNLSQPPSAADLAFQTQQTTDAKTLDGITANLAIFNPVGRVDPFLTDKAQKACLAIIGSTFITAADCTNAGITNPLPYLGGQINYSAALSVIRVMMSANFGLTV